MKSGISRPFDRHSEPQADAAPENSIASRTVVNSQSFRFRQFEIVPGERLLLRNGERVDIGSRAFDLFVVLLKSRGQLVTKREIVSRVWPATVVADSNLRFQMACLRAALGEDRHAIKTIPRRGYLLIADFDRYPRSPETHSDPTAGETHAFQRTLKPVVVVIDDDPDTREALEGLLRSAGWLVEAFASVQAFTAIERGSPPQCLILDVWMPGRSGLDFQEDLAKAGLFVPVIFISGHADVPMSVRAMKAGAVEFLTKPVRHEELLEALESTRTLPSDRAQWKYRGAAQLL